MDKTLIVNKLYVIPAGYAMIKEFFINMEIGADSDAMVRSPLNIYLLDTTAGLILIDTGFDEINLNPDCYKGTPLDGIIYPYMEERHRIPDLLNHIGCKPEDIRYLITTHFHLDHSGGSKYFKQVPNFVQRNELTILDDANYSPAECRLKDLNYQVVDGDYALCDNISLISTPGHAPGHQSVLVNTASSGYVLLCIDAALNEANFKGEKQYFAADPVQAEISAEKLKAIITEYDPIVIYGHDPDQDQVVRHYPEYY